MEININFSAAELDLLRALLLAYGTDEAKQLYKRIDEARSRLKDPGPVAFDYEDFKEFRLIGGIPTKSCLRRMISKKVEFCATYGHTKLGPDTITVCGDMAYCRNLVDRLRAQGARISATNHLPSITAITFIPTH